MLLTELVYCVTISFTMIKWAYQIHHDNVPAHSTALVQAFLAKHQITQVCQPPYSPDLAPLRLLAFPKAKIAIEMEETCKCEGHTVHKLSQWRLTAEWLATMGSDCSRTHSKVSSDRLPSYIKATWPVPEIFKMAGYFPDTRCSFNTIHCIINVKNNCAFITEYEFMLCSRGYISEYNKPSVTALHSADLNGPNFGTRLFCKWNISLAEKHTRLVTPIVRKICTLVLFIFIKSANKIVYQKQNSFTHQLTVSTAFEERKLDAVLHETTLFFVFRVTRCIIKILSMNSLFSGIFFSFLR